MQIDLEIKNYRCFSQNKPVRISLKPGFTALIGPNNSGKSSILKFFYEFRSIFQLIIPNSPEQLRQTQTPKGSLPLNLPPGIRVGEELFNNTNSNNIYFKISLPVEEPAGARPSHKKLLNEISFDVNRSEKKVLVNLYCDGQAMAKDSAVRIVENNKLALNSIIYDPSKIYEALNILSSTIYIGPYRNALNLESQTTYFDINIGNEFIKSWDNFKSGDDPKFNELAYELSQEIARIFSHNALEINVDPGNETLKLLINGKSYNLNQIGSGFAQFIIVLMHAAIQNKSYILIDEPEVHLHPSLQSDFLNTLAKYSKSGIVFATHNIGLARANSEHIYSLRSNEGEIEVAPFQGTKNLSQFLGELSYSSFNELGYKKILLVEGPTEVRAIQQFLRFYKKEHEIILLPLGGSSMINEEAEFELKELFRISDNIFAVIDSERLSDSAELSEPISGFKEICERTGINLHILNRRAFENYLTDHAIKKVKGNRYSALSHYAKLSEADHSWAKRENWRIANEMTKNDLDDTDLGEFLENL